MTTKTVQEIYSEYQIPANLQMHQLRVAALTEEICELLKLDKQSTETCVTAALFHDMANVIKFKLGDGDQELKKLQNNFKERYGNNVIEATKSIARELSLPEEVIELIDNVGFDRSPRLANPDIELYKKIVGYADQRVSPEGVTSLTERIDNGWERYKEVYFNPEDRNRFLAMRDAWMKVEQQLFESASATPEDITKRLIPIDKLRHHRITSPEGKAKELYNLRFA